MVSGAIVWHQITKETGGDYWVSSIQKYQGSVIKVNSKLISKFYRWANTYMPQKIKLEMTMWTMKKQGPVFQINYIMRNTNSCLHQNTLFFNGLSPFEWDPSLVYRHMDAAMLPWWVCVQLYSKYDCNPTAVSKSGKSSFQLMWNSNFLHSKLFHESASREWQHSATSD